MAIDRATTKRRKHQRSAYRFETRAISCLVIILLGWMLVFFAVYFIYFRTIPVLMRKDNNNNIISGGSPLLIFTYERANYLSKTLDNVYSNISQQCKFGCPIIVSEDGEHEEIRKTVLSYKEKFETIGIPLLHIHHQKQDQSRRRNPFNPTSAYVALARHYHWALSQVFDGNAGDSSFSPPFRVVILEEDIQVAPDFFSFMESTSSQLDKDSTLYAVSAFNDNGHVDNGDPKRLLRSDFFPGLGWMMTRDLWKNELQSRWAPNGYWDDWLRDPKQRKGRQVIRPEVSRTYHFGSKGGTSGNQFGSILERVKLNEKPIRWEMEDLSYLENSVYKKQYTELVMNSKLVNTLDEAEQMSNTGNVRIEYDNFAHFHELAKEIGIMDGEKAMVPRTAYRGIVEKRQGNSLLFLTPKGGFVGY